MTKNMPFAKAKMSQNEIDAMIYRTESKLCIEGTHRGVKGGVAPALLSLAAVFALIIAGAYFSLNSTVFDKFLIGSPAESDADIDEAELPEGVKFFYGETAVKYIAENYDQLAIEPIISENEHLRITIESLICDDITVNITAKIEALDDEGLAHLEAGTSIPSILEIPDDNKPMIAIVPEMFVYDENGNYLCGIGGSQWVASLGSPNQPDTEQCRYFNTFFEKAKFGEADKIHLKLFSSESVHGDKEPEDGIVDVFTGIEFNIDTASNIETITCVSDNDDETYISPLAFYSRKEKLTDNDSLFTINYKDGSSVLYFTNCFSSEYYELYGIESIEYNQKLYYPQ